MECLLKPCAGKRSGPEAELSEHGTETKKRCRGPQMTNLEPRKWLMVVDEEWRDQNGFMLYEMSGFAEQGLWRGKEWYSCLELAPTPAGFEPGTQRFVPKTKAEKRILLDEKAWISVSVTHMSSAVRGRTRKYAMVDRELECVQAAYAHLSGREDKSAVPAGNLDSASVGRSPDASKCLQTPVQARDSHQSPPELTSSLDSPSTRAIDSPPASTSFAHAASALQKTDKSPPHWNLPASTSGHCSSHAVPPGVQLKAQALLPTTYTNDLPSFLRQGGHGPSSATLPQAAVTEPSSTLPAAGVAWRAPPRGDKAQPGRKRGRPLGAASAHKAPGSDQPTPPAATATENEVILIDDDPPSDQPQAALTQSQLPTTGGSSTLEGPIPSAPAAPATVVAGAGRLDRVFEFLLNTLTTGDLGGGHTVFQLISDPKANPRLIKGSINFGKDGRLSFASAEAEGIVLSLAEERQARVRELLSPMGYSQDAVLLSDGTLENRGMEADAFAALTTTVTHMRREATRMAEGCRQVPKRVGKFAYFCAVCGRRFTYPAASLLAHVRMHL